MLIAARNMQQARLSVWLRVEREGLHWPVVVAPSASPRQSVYRALTPRAIFDIVPSISEKIES